MLGVAPALGRDFIADDDRPGAPRTAILTHGLWVRRFGGEPSIVGTTITLDREPHTVIGVLAPSFRSPFGAPEIFRPMQMNPVGAPRNRTIQMIARLKAGVAFEQAQADMDRVGQALARELPRSDAGSTIRLTHLHDEVVGNVRTPVLALLGAVVLVLLIACANIGNLQLARASIRAREIAVRTALGAARTRIVRQLLTESLLLGVVGSIAGLLLSFWMLDALVAMAPEGTPRLADVRIDPAVLAFGVVLALGTSIVFGLVPAIHSVRGDVAATIKEGGKGTGAPHAGVAARSVFIVAELALALMLLVGAGLLMRTLANMRGVNPGFNPENVVSAVITLPSVGYQETPQVRAFYRALLERLEGAPGVKSAALVSVLPFSGTDTDTGFQIEGRPPITNPGDRPSTWFRIVSAGYARTMGLRLEEGRFLEESDREDVQRVAVINRRLANRYWPGETPIGKRIVNGGQPITIVGIVSDVHHRSLSEEPLGEMYLSYLQFNSRRQTVVIKAAGETGTAVSVLRERVAAVDRSVPISSVATMESLMADSLALPRMITMLMTAFAAASLLLAAIGIYGLMAYAVTLRTQEFGIRMALGAKAADVLRLVLGQAARLAVVGIVVGTIAAFAAARLIAALLFGVTASDVPTFALTAFLLGAVTLLASYLPARRAIHVDPVTALRSE